MRDFGLATLKLDGRPSGCVLCSTDKRTWRHLFQLTAKMAVYGKLRVHLNGFKVCNCLACMSPGSDGEESMGGSTQPAQAAARTQRPSPKARATADSGGGALAQSLLPCNTRKAQSVCSWLDFASLEKPSSGQMHFDSSASKTSLVASARCRGPPVIPYSDALGLQAISKWSIDCLREAASWKSRMNCQR